MVRRSVIRFPSMIPNGENKNRLCFYIFEINEDCKKCFPSLFLPDAKLYPL